MKYREWPAVACGVLLAMNAHECANAGHHHAAHFHHHHPQTAESKVAAQASDRVSQKRRIPLSGPSAQAFQPFDTVNAFVEGEFLIVESDGLPAHNMMVGIRSWQQQVPLPQPFSADNAWRLPLKPRPSSSPISVLKEPLRGAIALAVNGVPIFCALNNRGEDTLLAGELDEWGGHCGRGDDYHYHIAPLHLEDQVGVGNPIAYAVDGYPILGLTEPDGSLPTGLDEFNGHRDKDGHYHYHASNDFPYINGGLHGVVFMDGDQVRQPKDSPIRPAMSPLKGAHITAFERTNQKFELTYSLNNQAHKVRYEVLDAERVHFEYEDENGAVRVEEYDRQSASDRRQNPAVWIALAVTFSMVLLLLLKSRRG